MPVLTGDLTSLGVGRTPSLRQDTHIIKSKKKRISKPLKK